MLGWEFPPHISGGLGVACYGLVDALVSKSIDINLILPTAKEGFSDQKLKIRDAGREYLRHRSYFNNDQLKHTHVLKSVDYLTTTLMPYSYEGKYIKDRTTINPRKGSGVTNSHLLDDLGLNKNLISPKYDDGLYHEIHRYSIAAGSIINQYECDLIHCHDWMTVGAGIIAKSISKKPLIYHVHATEFDRSGEIPNQFVYDIERSGVEAADIIIAVSERTKQTLVHRYGANPDKVKVIHNGVISENQMHRARQFESSVPIVSFLGRITRQKGPDYFVQVAEKVIAQNIPVRFVMAGNGDLYQSAINRVASLGIGNHFSFTGFLDRDRIADLLSASSVFVMPSVSEPFGITPLEAARYRTPLIISRQSGVAEVFKNAFKVDYWDIDKMSQLIIAILKYPNLKNHISALAESEAKSMTWERPAQDVISVYKQILSS